MKVLHLFDRYLNTTMNWAHNIMAHMVDVEQFVAAPILINNEFNSDKIQLLESPFQKMMELAKDEWHISLAQKAYAKLGIRKFQQFILSQIEANKIQLVHLHFASVACQHMDWLNEMKIPFVVSFYGYDYEKLPYVNPAYIKKYNRLFKLTEMIICEGEHGRNILISNYSCPLDKIKVVPIGVNQSNISFHQREKKKGELHILQAATFTEKKGHYYTIRAFHQALNLCPNLHLSLTGEDWEKGMLESIKKYVVEHDIDDKVSFIDFIPYSELHQFLASYHVLIQPSVYAKNRDCEGGAPVVILDAMATGMPAIGSDHCDIPNLIMDKKTGWICPSNDIDSLTEVIVDLYEMNQQEYDTFSHQSRNRIEQEFDIKSTSSNIKNIYSNMIKNS